MLELHSWKRVAIVGSRCQRWIGLANVAKYLALICICWLVVACSTVLAQENRVEGASGVVNDKVSLGEVAQFLRQMSPEAQRGYRHLLDSVYLPADFDDEIVERLEKAKKPHPYRDSSVDLSERGRMFERFGLTVRPDDPESGLPLQYVHTERGEFVMNCFACHGGSVYGVSYPGAPNNAYALETLTEAVRREKLRANRPLSHMDIGSAFMPLGSTVGTTNAVMFGVALMHFRDKDLNVQPLRPAPEMQHHDMDPPAWWHFHRKKQIYIDGFAQKGHRGLMQFMLVRQNGPEKFREWEKDFADVYQFISELRAPKSPLMVDAEKVAKGKEIFSAHCASCHGTYGVEGEYPEVMVSLDDVGTDPVRWKSLSAEHRRAYGESWFAEYGGQNTLAEPEGYVAPPLDGIWATAPYLHNGSVPTLWDLLHPDARPVVWRRSDLAMDETKVGLSVERLEEVPKGLSSEEKRRYFDTRRFGKGGRGHDYPNRLTEEEKVALLEYLKTL